MNAKLGKRPATILSLVGAVVFIGAALSFTTGATAGVHKRDICHVTNVPADGDGHVISIADPAWLAHEAHGDKELGDPLVTVDDPWCHVLVTTAPDAVDDEVTTPINTAVNIDVLENDFYVAPVFVSVGMFPQNGILGIVDVGIFEYTPNTGVVGTDSFEYEICNAIAECDGATVTITVGP